MNIPSLEAILTDLDEARRQRNASNRKIEELTDALDNAGLIIERLTTERDAAMAENAAYYQLAKKEVWAVAEAALREAKDALVMNIVGTGGRTPAAHNAVATINKVLGEE